VLGREQVTHRHGWNNESHITTSREPKGARNFPANQDAQIHPDGSPGCTRNHFGTAPSGAFECERKTHKVCRAHIFLVGFTSCANSSVVCSVTLNDDSFGPWSIRTLARPWIEDSSTRSGPGWLSLSVSSFLR
jgi:hypothetical protein